MTHPSPASMWRLAQLGLLLGCSSALASDGISSGAPERLFYAGIGEDCCGEDPHPVHGAATPDDGFVVCGKSIDRGGEWEGFVVKVGDPLPSGTTFLEPGDTSYAWSHTFGRNGVKDVANAVVALDDAVFVAGLVSGEDRAARRMLRKLDLSTGALVWELVLDNTSAGTESALESLWLTEDGGLLAGGLVGAERDAIEGFKSYGNPWDGKAVVMYLSPEQLASDIAPTGPAWEETLPSLISTKSIRDLPEGGYALIAFDREERSVAVRLDAEGGLVWKRDLADHGEATDLTVLTQGGATQAIAIVGHRGGSGGGIDGSVTALDLEGDTLWRKSYGNPAGGEYEFEGLDAGNPQLIFDECWGIASTPDGGAVLACGTGIEGCPYPVGNPLRQECRQDPRRIWRGLIIGIDADGNEQWHRVDSFRFPGEEQDEAPDAASEYVIVTPDGRVASVVDQGFGIGLMLLDAPEGSASSPVGDTPGTDDAEDDGVQITDTGFPDNADLGDGLGSSSGTTCGCSAQAAPGSLGFLGGLGLLAMLRRRTPRTHRRA